MDPNESQSKSFNVKIDQKIYNLLVSDSIDFKVDKINTVINRIFKSFVEEQKEDNLEGILEEQLKKLLNKKGLKDILSSDTTKKIKELYEILKPLRRKIYPTIKLKKTPEIKQLNFRLTTDNTEYFIKYLNTITPSNSDFFRECFEWYTRKAKYEREKILCIENYTKLKEAIEKKMIIKIWVSTNEKSEIYETYPYFILSSPNENFNYLLSVDKKTKKIYPTRLSNINRVILIGERFKEISERNLNENEKKENKIGKKEIDDLNLRIKNHEVTIGERKKIILELTKEGYNKFKIIVHNRPIQEENCKITKQEIGYRMEFESTEAAVKYYFLAFGAECKIIQPEKLKENFRKFYEEALDIYNKNEGI